MREAVKENNHQAVLLFLEEYGSRRSSKIYFGFFNEFFKSFRYFNISCSFGVYLGITQIKKIAPQ